MSGPQAPTAAYPSPGRSTPRNDVRFSAPSFAEDDLPPGFGAVLAQLRNAPGRWRNSLLLTAQVILTIVIGETFRVPQLSVLVFISFFMSGNDAASSVRGALLSGGMILLGTALTIIFLMFSLSEPAVRLPCMLLLTLAAGYLSQAMTRGPLVNVLLFWIVYMSINGDTLEQAGYGLDAFIGNTPESAIPDAAFLPPEEALLHVLLWIAAVFIIALTILVIANRLAGFDPIVMLRKGIVDRLRAIAAACDDDCAGDMPSASRIRAFADQGVAGLRQQHDLAASLHPDLPHHRGGLAMIRCMSRLVLIMTAWTRIEGDGGSGLLRAAAHVARLCADTLEHRRTKLPALAAEEIDLAALASRLHGDPMRHPLAMEFARTLTVVRALLLKPDPERHGFLHAAIQPAAPLFKADAWRNPAYLRAALKLTLSVSICYAITRFAAWPGIATCVVTCFLVSLSTVGDTVHKMTLRISGALIGAACGIGTILLIMPMLTDLTDLLLAVLPVTLFAAWVKSGSERIAYAGVQIAMAYFMTVLHGYAPTLDMETGRDRVIGILLGNVVVYLVSTTLWPVSVASAARVHLVSAVRMLGELVAYRRADFTKLVDTDQEILREKFGQAVAAVRTAGVNALLEGRSVRSNVRRSPIDARLLTEIQMLSVPVAILTDAPLSPNDAVIERNHQLRAWFNRFADWIAQGGDSDTLLADLPSPPHLPADPERDLWYAILDERIRAVLAGIASPAAPLLENRHAPV